MGDYLRRAYDEAERAMSRGDSDATQTRQDVADEVEEAVKAACDRILPAHYMTEETYQHLRQRVAELRAENDRLRELALMMFGCAKASECDECRELNDGYACAYIMQELGIEVSE